MVDKGPRHFMPTGAPPGWIGIRFEGNEQLSSADLQRVIDQVSYDVIRRDFYTESEMLAGLRACKDLYRAKGYQDAHLDLVEVEISPRGWPPIRALGAPLRLVTGNPPRKKAVVSEASTD